MIVEPCKILEVNLTNDHVYVPLVNNSRLTRRMQLVEQELLTLPEHLNSPPVFSGVRVTRSLVVCVYFVDHCLSFFFWPFCCLFFFDIRIRITPFGIFKLFFPTQKRQSLPQSYWSLPSDNSVEEIAKTWKNCIMLESSRKLLGILK